MYFCRDDTFLSRYVTSKFHQILAFICSRKSCVNLFLVATLAYNSLKCNYQREFEFKELGVYLLKQ